MDRQDKIKSSLLLVFISLTTIVLLLYGSSNEKVDVVIDNFSFDNASYVCSNPFYNSSDNYWYCDIDDMVVS